MFKVAILSINSIFQRSHPYTMIEKFFVENLIQFQNKLMVI